MKAKNVKKGTLIKTENGKYLIKIRNFKMYDGETYTQCEVLQSDRISFLSIKGDTKVQITELPF